MLLGPRWARQWIPVEPTCVLAASWMKMTIGICSWMQGMTTRLRGFVPEGMEVEQDVECSGDESYSSGDDSTKDIQTVNDPDEDLRTSFLRSVERLFRDAHDQAMYTVDYSTKASPTIGHVLGEQALGEERYQLEKKSVKQKVEEGAEAEGRGSEEETAD
eukprot:4733777-Karenia_brevis.AAC.1